MTFGISVIWRRLRRFAGAPQAAVRCAFSGIGKKPGSRAAFIDAYSAGSALVDTHLQAVELTRDPSHVRDYSIAEWTAALALAGFRIDDLRTFRVRMDFPVWVARIATPDENVKALRKMQVEAPDEVKRHTELEPDGSFMLDVMMIQATAG